jgi:hypothetical protein
MFQYGTTTAYGLHTRVQDAGPNAVNRTVYAHLGRLTPGTAYHYRLVATNNAGTATGGDQTLHHRRCASERRDRHPSPSQTGPRC